MPGPTRRAPGSVGALKDRATSSKAVVFGLAGLAALWVGLTAPATSPVAPPPASASAAQDPAEQAPAVLPDPGGQDPATSLQDRRRGGR